MQNVFSKTNYWNYTDAVMLSQFWTIGAFAGLTTGSLAGVTSASLLGLWFPNTSIGSEMSVAVYMLLILLTFLSLIVNVMT